MAGRIVVSNRATVDDSPLRSFVHFTFACKIISHKTFEFQLINVIHARLEYNYELNELIQLFIFYNR